ncbi:MAG: transcription factor S [Candidatus Bathyarchaeia archaeon]
MKFCPKCDTALIPSKREGSVLFTCPKCGYELSSKEKEVRRIKRERENVVVIGREEQKLRTLPTAKAECPKCGNKRAFYWMVQTRGADESSTQFFRCTKCSYTWRETT